MLDILRYLRHNIPTIRAIYLAAMPYRAARRFYFSGFAAVSRHHLMVMRLLVCRSIQPERLNAEGDSPSACSRGLSVSATPGISLSP